MSEEYTLARCEELLDSEGPDAPYNPDLWELRARIDWLIARVRHLEDALQHPDG